jgi:hypothetical protein
MLKTLSLLGAAVASLLVALIVATMALAAPHGASPLGEQNSAPSKQLPTPVPPVGTPAPKNIVPSFPPCSPYALPTPGVNSAPVQVGPDSWDDFVTSNQWTGPVNGSSDESYVVWAGMTGQDGNPPNTPAVAVALRSLSSDHCATTQSAIRTFTISAPGSLRIISASAGSVILEAANSDQQYSFNLTSDGFQAVSG